MNKETARQRPAHQSTGQRRPLDDAHRAAGRRGLGGRHLGWGSHRAQQRGGQDPLDLDVGEINSFDLREVAESWFGTASLDHPGVARLAAGGGRFVAGEVTLVERPMSGHERYELSPTRTRLIFSQKGWSRVIGFHTRNVPHRVHEFIQFAALDMVHADGLYISPVIGQKSGDFLSGPILQSYQVLLESGVYPPGKVVLGAFSTYSRYCGPQAVLPRSVARTWAATTSSGRDHAASDWYKDHQSARTVREPRRSRRHADLLRPYGFNLETNQYDVLSEAETVVISGTTAENGSVGGDPLPDWFVRDAVQMVLRDRMATDGSVFWESKPEPAAATERVRRTGEQERSG